MSNQKTPEELKRERDEAKEQWDQIMSTSRPKNLGEGVSTGVSNVIAGAVGAAGVAVLLPTLGLVTGARGGGIVGGAVGLAIGGAAGIIGAAALAVGGAVSGGVQIGRGIAAVPQSIAAPRQGKWWNENLGKWVSTKMDDEKKSLDGVPDDDSDILRPLQDDVDASVSFCPESNVADMYYYECLDVPASAEPALLKRRYYMLARQYHPDKVGTDDLEAAEKFKEVAEAYQVLSDPELRKKYDKEGRAGLSADKTSTVDGGFNGIDPALLFAFLFGSDKFHNYVGRYVRMGIFILCFLCVGMEKDGFSFQVKHLSQLLQTPHLNIQYYVDSRQQHLPRWVILQK
jgi:DnaJ domain